VDCPSLFLDTNSEAPLTAVPNPLKRERIPGGAVGGFAAVEGTFLVGGFGGGGAALEGCLGGV
jgi:hypothetical protein